ncbi:hypothetical protein CC85DRAFT_261889 [Cutaneotrichosporon oleaginosum]|uniref:SNF2 family DNA-dependent ATPase n=1 Tax=Cutaneotrichosporon oleaginosum TaxID=879819 RepID=A0A0J0XK68_9TREE|nr:uncharacterized protein CC85DRAFT_261889 [Cutaneotrichosporon oleaginosum]KLT41475.1 hypothetical protein CC85DRAFT_261889 [Cutaneotrichosporon oleaginosum]TXT05874.1 hypothetical protein COLE_07194 [Cutaneotrichosporon oleaginosum]
MRTNLPDDKRRALLTKLKDKRAPVPAPPDTPERDRILVPPSSSPTAPPPKARGTLIPSSNLARPIRPDGSPQAVMDAFKRPSAADYSPDSPQPLSRLKKRYEDSPSASPTKATGSAMPLPNAGSPSSVLSQARGGVKANKLISLAKQTHSDQVEVSIKRLKVQFPGLEREVYRRALERHGSSNSDALLKELRAAKVKADAAHSSQNSASSSTSNLAASLQKYVFEPGVPTKPSSQRSSPAPPPPEANRSASPAKRPRKNEKSTIYARREKQSNQAQRRDPDEESDHMSSDDGEAWNDGTRRRKRRKSEDEIDAEGEALKAFNTAEAEVLTGTMACSEEQAEKIIKLRPYEDVDDVQAKLSKTRGVSFKLFEQYVEIMEGYVQIDNCLNGCDSIAQDIAQTLSVWKGAATTSDSIVGTPRSDGLNDAKIDVAKVSELLLAETDMRRKKILASYIRQQPALLSEGTVLKDYQLLGVNWLNLLYTRKIGCILADEMGLGKTIQVIAFLAHLKEHGIKGPHMIYVPASTLENWTREFQRFAPEIDVVTYYGSQSERAQLRDQLKRQFRAGDLEVVLASYTQVAAKDDLSFFKRKIEFETCIYDEGHALKSFDTKRYKDLLSIVPKWRLLLTGTPVQNNLQELVSLLMFIHTDMFADAEPYLRQIFKVQSASAATLLSASRTSRARTMLSPFVLRRRKANVLTLPPKIETVEECDMTPAQARLYRETMRRSRKVIAEMGEDALEAAAAADDEGKAAATKKKKSAKDAKVAVSSSNILMDLRKAANHPLLFRRLYTKAKVEAIAKACLNTPQWADSRLDYVIEDLEIMSDAEIHNFVKEHDELAKFALAPSVFLEGGKMQALVAHIERCKAEGKRMLLFSQFTMILNILQVALDHIGVKWTRLDGATRTDERQGLVDEFNDDTDITVFLLSTKAGGVGINLTAASVVVIFDQDFNPHNDRQAADRAYRIGQEREVEVIKLVSRGSIDEDILSIGLTKLELDDKIAADADVGGEQTAREVKKSLLTTLKSKFQDEGEEAEDDEPIEDDEIPSTQMKRARGGERLE